MIEAITLKDVFDELKKIEEKMATKEEVEALTETLDILTNPKTMDQISESNKDLAENRVKTIYNVKDMLRE